MPIEPDRQSAQTNGRWTTHAAATAIETHMKLERDRALGGFLRQRIADVGLHGCGAERKALAGVAQALQEFEEKCERLAGMAPDDYFTAQIDTLRWVLQCVASGTFSSHPEFLAGFRPSRASAITALMEVRS